MAYFGVPSAQRHLTRFWTSCACIVAVVAAMLTVVGVVTAAPSRADTPGTEGFFTPASGRPLDTGTALQPGTVQPVGLGGHYGLPASGVSAVALTITAVDPSGTGNVIVQPYGATTTSPISQLSFQAGERVSNTAMVAVSSDVKIQVSVTVATRVLIDVQGYYSSGNGTVAPGGFVANTNGGERVADTTAGLNVPLAKVASNSDLTIDLTGRAGVASTATAVFANITVISHDPGEGYIVPYSTGSQLPGTSLNYPGGNSTSLASVVDINSNERFTIHVGTGNQQPIDIRVDIQGYFDSSDSRGGFTPGSARVYDTRPGAANLQMAPNTVREVQVSNIAASAGSSGVPAASTGIGALALEVTAISSATNTGNNLRIWGRDQSEPTTADMNINGAISRSALNMVVPGATTDTVFVRNTGNANLDVVLDVEGWYATAGNLPAASSSNCAASGQRPSSHQIPHQLTDRMSMSWNPVNGNMNLREPLMHLTGAGQSIDFGLRYNSLNDARPTFSAGWTESALTVNPASNTVTYTGPDGACYVFTKSGSTFSAPAYVNATLTQPDADTYTLRMNPSGITNTYKDKDASDHYVSVWQLASSTDAVGGNYITYTYDAANNRLASIAEADAVNRSLTFAYADPRNPLQPSTVTDTSLNRTATFTYGGPAGAMDSLTDAAGDKLTLGYGGPNSNQIISVTDNNTTDGGTGHTTAISYDSARRVSTWTYANVTGATTASAYTANYPSSTQTTLTDALHPATTFALANTTASAPAGIGTAVVTITDPLSHATNFSYTAHGDVTKTTNARGETGTTTFGGSNYLVNSSTAAGSGSGGTVPGAATYMDYPGDTHNTGVAKDQDGGSVGPCGANATGGLGDYRPCSSTDAQGHVSGYTYDSVSQNVATVSTSGNAGGTQTFTYERDSGHTDCGARNGEICSATDGDGGNHKTTFGYDLAGDLTRIDRPAGLGDIVMTYDAAGRIASRTDGNGNTSYFSYDGNDRPTQVIQNSTTCTVSSAGACVQYFYDHAGNMLTRTDRTGTTSYTFDQQNRMLDKQTKTLGSNTVTADNAATYDAVGNRTSNTDLTDDGPKTVTYGYDAGNRNVWLAEPGTTSCPTVTVAQTAPTAGCVLFLYDEANRRTHTYLPNSRDNYVEYDTNGRPSYLDNRPYGSNPYGPTAGRSYAYTSGPKVAGANTAGGMVSATGTASGSYSSYYRYDGMNHLLDQGNATAPLDNAASAFWHYDQNGNRTQASTTGTGGTTTYATYNEANQLCWTGPAAGTGPDGSQCTAPTAGSTSYTYDPAGNLASYGLTGSAADHAYSYSIYDQLTATTYSTTTTNYGYADVTSDERTQAGTDTIDNGMNGVSYVNENGKNVEYIRDPAGTLIEMRTKNGTNPWVTMYYTLDRLGSVTLLTNNTGATMAAPTYDAWGVTTSPAPTNGVALLNRYGYASGYTDPTTGLVKYGTRYYAPSLGVWTQADPAAQGANYYIYAGDDPTTNTDPTGRSSSDVSGSLCAFFWCLDAGVTTDDDGDDHFHIGAGPSTDEAGADLSFTDSTDDGESGGYVSASCTAGGYTGGVSADEGGFSDQGGVDIGTGDAEPGCDAEAGYEF